MFARLAISSGASFKYKHGPYYIF